MRKWLVSFLADVFAEFFQRTAPHHIPYCDHGFIAITCEWCRIQRGEK